MFVAALGAQGITVRVIRFDSGREFTAEDTKAALANTGVHAEFTTTDRFINNAERAHLTLQRGERAVLTAAPEVPACWRAHARAYAAFSHNVALPSAGGLSPCSRPCYAPTSPSPRPASPRRSGAGRRGDSIVPFV